MPRSLDYEKAARALVHAEVYGKADAAREFNVSRKTIYNWRDRCKEDEKLRVRYTAAKRAFLHHWAEDASPVLRKGLKKLEKIIDRLDPVPGNEDRILDILVEISHLVNVKTAIDRKYGMPDHVPSPESEDVDGNSKVHRISGRGGRADAG